MLCGVLRPTRLTEEEPVVHRQHIQGLVEGLDRQHLALRTPMPTSTSTTSCYPTPLHTTTYRLILAPGSRGRHTAGRYAHDTRSAPAEGRKPPRPLVEYAVSRDLDVVPRERRHVLGGIHRQGHGGYEA
jgi:hypothetical protein